MECRLDSQRSDQWQALANTVVKKRVALNAKNFLNGKETVCLSRRDVLCGDSEFVSLLNRCVYWAFPSCHFY